MKRVLVDDDVCDGADDDDDDDDGDEEGGGRKHLDVDERNVFRETLQSTLPEKHNHTSDSTFIDRFYDFVSRYVLSRSSLLSLPPSLRFLSLQHPCRPVSFFSLTDALKSA